jgi:inosine/xanthosine triphosphatase
MKTIILASKNPVKIQATLDGFRRTFPGEAFRIETVSVPSGVHHQPQSDRETLQGALNRAENAARAVSGADYWVGIEGGIEDDGAVMMAFAWIVVRSRGRVGRGRTGTFLLPPAVTQLIRQGHELGDADDMVFARSNSKQDSGAVGLLTGDLIDRTMLYEHAVILALVPFKNPALFPVEEDPGPHGRP